MKRESYDQVARIGKALSNGGRLELLELLAQAEQSVEDMARMTRMGITNVSSHLQVLKNTGLVSTRRDGVKIYYRLSGPGVATLLVSMKKVSANLLPRTTEKAATGDPDFQLEAIPMVQLTDEVRESYMLDVRPTREYLIGHYPGAVSIPISELKARVAELPRDRQVVVYCRSEFCLMARQAAQILREEGIDAWAMDEGVLEWRADTTVALTAAI